MTPEEIDEYLNTGVHLYCGDMWGIDLPAGLPQLPRDYLKHIGVKAECYSASSMFGFKFKVIDPETLPDERPHGFSIFVGTKRVDQYSRDAILAQLKAPSI